MSSQSQIKGLSQSSQPNAVPEGSLWYDTSNDVLKSSDGTTYNQVGRTSFSGAAVVSHSTTIGDYTQPSEAVAGDTTFQDRYTTNTGWTQTSTEITVDSTTADMCHFAGATASGAVYRAVHKALGSTLSDSKWIMRFKYVYTSTAGGGPLHLIATLRAGTSDPTGSGDHIAIVHHAAYSGLIIDAKDGASATGNTTGLTLVAGNTYYVQLERTTTTNITISAFSDATFTTHIANSPQSHTIASTAGNSLTTLIHSNISTNGAEALTADIDEMEIYNNKNAADITSISQLIDNSTSTVWTSISATNPSCYVDMGSALNLCAIAMYYNSAATTETEIKIQTSSDASTWTDKRTITTSNLTNGAWNYYRFNIAGGARYIRVYGTGTSKALSIKEIKVMKKTDAQIFADLGIVEISSSDTALDGDGV